MESYAQSEDWVFPSLKLRGRKPRAANMLVQDYIRPAAVKAGVLAETDTFRLGFHNLRHSLASFLVRTKTDPKMVLWRDHGASVRAETGVLMLWKQGEGVICEATRRGRLLGARWCG